jgi:hypothetical protein
MNAYSRCASGHYHIGVYCLYDGASSDVSKKLTISDRTGPLSQLSRGHGVRYILPGQMAE